ncbi:aspartic proteinase CDR1-like [Oryza sativa Japonica Group]|uniref:aspartic proteinase CDR1-like n=1 Tax=Oryza sativa subsp. japonica TaxID=39947 RepID=UPI00339CA441
MARLEVEDDQWLGHTELGKRTLRRGVARPEILLQSYCLVPHSVNTSSVLNFGALANITEPGVATTQLVAGDVDTYYTVVLDSVKVGNKTVASAASSRIIVDSGTMLTFLDPALMGPLIDELSRRITLPPMQSPDGLLQLCYEVAGREVEAGERITNHIDKHLYSTVESCSDNQTSRKQTEQVSPDLTLEFGSGGGGAEAGERVRDGAGRDAVPRDGNGEFAVGGHTRVPITTLCLAIVATTEQQTVSILRNLGQQNIHVGYNLDAGTVTFAAADCAGSGWPAKQTSGGQACF